MSSLTLGCIIVVQCSRDLSLPSTELSSGRATSPCCHCPCITNVARAECGDITAGDSPVSRLHHKHQQLHVWCQAS